MKKSVLILPMLFIACISHAQVNWTFSAKKTSDKTFEIHLSATVAKPWHLYSQFTPEGGPVPTEIKFGSNPILQQEGTITESGKMTTRKEAVFGIDVKYFDGSVDFIQQVKLKANAATTITGSIKYMVCNDRECLPPKTQTFSIPIK